MMDRFAFSVLLVLAAAPAFAASDSEARLCSDARLEPPLRVEACTRALALRDLTKQQHLLLLGARASALDELGDHARAIADFDSAIVLSPGPCDPAQAGICLPLTKAAAAANVPLLGVCAQLTLE